MSETFPPVANSFYLKENFSPNKAAFWHQYFTGAAPNNDTAQWIKLASWTHTNKFNTFGAQFNVINRHSNVAINVHIHWGLSQFIESETSLSFIGAAASSFKARLVKVSDSIIGGLPAVDMELWVRHGRYSQEGFVSVDSLGGFIVNKTQAIKLYYKDVYTDSVLGNEVEPAGEIVREIDFKGGVNAMLYAPSTRLIIQNGFASHSDPLSFRVSSTGLVEVSGGIDATNADGSPATAAPNTLVSRLPSGYLPPKSLRFAAVMDNGDIVPLFIDALGALKFVKSFTSKVYIYIQYQL